MVKVSEELTEMAKKKNDNIADDLLDTLLADEENSSIKTRILTSVQDAEDLHEPESKVESKKKLAWSDPMADVSHAAIKNNEAADADRTLQIAQVEEDLRQQLEQTRPNMSSDRSVTGAVQQVLIHSESLKFAQDRIHQLEQESEAFRVENDQLRASEQTLKMHTEELYKKIQNLELQVRESKVVYNEEISLREIKIQAKEKDITKLKLKVDELETRLSGDIKRVRMRERELENRLEVLKIEHSAVVRSKDEMILQLKRNVDQGLLEIENFKNKGRGMSSDIEQYHDKIRRTVKALRLTLSMLDGVAEEEDETTKAG